MYGLDVRASDLEARAKSLAQTALPLCAHGNDPSLELGIWLGNTTIGTTYVGPIVYRSINAESPGTLLFDAPNLMSQGVGAPLVGLTADPQLFETPSLGRKFWLSYPGKGLGAVLEQEGGAPIALVADRLVGPFTEVESAWLSQTLGVDVRAEKRCDDLSGGGLWDVVFGTDPPTLAKSGARTLLQLGDEPYVVWVWGRETVSLVMYAR